MAASLLAVGCKQSVKPAEPSPYPTGAWMFHALNGEVGQGPLLRFEGGVFSLEGCGSAVGTIVSVADSQVLQVGDAAACSDKEQAVQAQLLALFSATPQMASPNARVCGATQGLEIRTKDRQAIFCELEPYHPE
jgi:hypothetical protein